MLKRIIHKMGVQRLKKMLEGIIYANGLFAVE